jgi:DNA modification methylase
VTKQTDLTAGADAPHPSDHNFPFRVDMVPTSSLKVSDSVRIYSANDKRNARRVGNRFGIQLPVVADTERNVIIGESLLLAALEAGVEEIGVIWLKSMSKLEAQALSVAYSRLGDLGKPDCEKIGQIMLQCEVELGFDVADFGYEVAEVDLMIGAVNDEPEEEPVLPEKQPVSNLLDIWKLRDHRIICGDATDPHIYELLLEREKVCAIFADPPYGCAVDGFVSGKGRHREFVMGSGDMNTEELRRFFTAFNRGMAKHLIPGAVIYETIDFRSVHTLLDATREIFGPLLNLGVWSKDRMGQGSFLRSQHELVLIFKNKGRMRNNVMLGKFGRSRSNIWNYPSAVTTKAGEEGDILSEHPTPKPPKMIADAFLDVTKRNDVVLDPFGGSGSTLIAAERIGRRARLIELDPIYVDLAVRRWQSWTGLQAVHADTGELFDERAARVAAAAVAAAE